MRLPTLEDVFNSLVAGTPTYNAERYDDSEPFTMGSKRILREMGQKYGFIVQDLESVSEFLTLDQVWLEGDYIILAMEHEQQEDPIPDEWKKLVNVKGRIKVLITYESDPIKREELVKRARCLVLSNPFPLPGEKYLLIVGSIPREEGKTRDDPFIRYYGFAFDNSGNEIKRLRSHVVPLRQNVM